MSIDLSQLSTSHFKTRSFYHLDGHVLNSHIKSYGSAGSSIMRILKSEASLDGKFFERNIFASGRNSDLEQMFKKIQDRRSDYFLMKSKLWKEIFITYLGGETYISALADSNKSKKETADRLFLRQHVSIFVNYLDYVLTQYVSIFMRQPPSVTIRGNVITDEEREKLFDNVDFGVPFNLFFRDLCIKSLMFPVSIRLENEQGTSVRKDKPLVADIVLPFFIEDYYFNDDGVLDWVYAKYPFLYSADPFKEPVDVMIHDIYTRSKRYLFFSNETHSVVFHYVEYPNTMNIVPYVFSNVRELQGKSIEPSMAEDLTRMTRVLFNAHSYLFKSVETSSNVVLSVPMNSANQVEEYLQKGLFSHEVMGYPASSNNKPEFIGTDVTNIKVVSDVIDSLKDEILTVFGLGRESDTDFTQSGLSKSMEKEKMRSVLEMKANDIERLYGDLIYALYVYSSKRGDDKIQRDDIGVKIYTEFTGYESGLKVDHLVMLYKFIATSFPFREVAEKNYMVGLVFKELVHIIMPNLREDVVSKLDGMLKPFLDGEMREDKLKSLLESILAIQETNTTGGSNSTVGSMLSGASSKNG